MNDNFSSHKSSEYEDEIIKTIPFYKHFHTCTIDLVKSLNTNPKTWLDTGCGTGTLIEKALVQFPGCTFYLADPSEKMLEICKRKFNQSNVKILGVSDTSSLNIDFTPEVITAIQCHHYLNKNERKIATEKCYKLLKEKGIYITFENIRFKNNAANKAGLKRWGKYQIGMGRDKQIVQEQLARFDKNYFPITISEHLELLKQTGFRVVEQIWMSNMQAGFYGMK